MGLNRQAIKSGYQELPVTEASHNISEVNACFRSSSIGKLRAKTNTFHRGVFLQYCTKVATFVLARVPPPH